MASSNRLEAMDAVVNLREMHRLLTRAEADEGRRERVAVFPLKHRKAEEVAAKVRELLGLAARCVGSRGRHAKPARYRDRQIPIRSSQAIGSERPAVL